MLHDSRRLVLNLGVFPHPALYVLPKGCGLLLVVEENPVIPQREIRFDLAPHFLGNLPVGPDHPRFALPAVVDDQIPLAAQLANLHSHASSSSSSASH